MKGNSFEAAAAYTRMVLKEFRPKMTTQERMLLTALEEKDHWRSRALIAEKQENARQEMDRKSSLDDKPHPDCSCIRSSSTTTPLLEIRPGEIFLYGRWLGMSLFTKRDCPECGGSGYRRKVVPYGETIQKAWDLAREEDRRKNEGSAHMAEKVAAQPHLVDHCCPECLNLQVPVREGNLDVYRCVNPTCSKSPKNPIRLLVEVVPQKDEKHGTGAITFPNGISLRVGGPYEEGKSAAMSVQELPSIGMNQLIVAFNGSAGHACRHVPGGMIHDGIRAVLKACGLEVGE